MKVLDAQKVLDESADLIPQVLAQGIQTIENIMRAMGLTSDEAIEALGEWEIRARTAALLCMTGQLMKDMPADERDMLFGFAKALATITDQKMSPEEVIQIMGVAKSQVKEAGTVEKIMAELTSKIAARA